MSARIILRRKRRRATGLLEYVIWSVPSDARNPEGVRYRLVFVPGGCDRPGVLYDNHHPKGHHKHVDGVEAKYAYRGIPGLVEDFEADVMRWLEKEKRSS